MCIGLYRTRRNESWSRTGAIDSYSCFKQLSNTVFMCYVCYICLRHDYVNFVPSLWIWCVYWNICYNVIHGIMLVMTNVDWWTILLMRNDTAYEKWWKYIAWFEMMYYMIHSNEEYEKDKNMMHCALTFD